VESGDHAYLYPGTWYVLHCRTYCAEIKPTTSFVFLFAAECVGRGNNIHTFYIYIQFILEVPEP